LRGVWLQVLDVLYLKVIQAKVLWGVEAEGVSIQRVGACKHRRFVIIEIVPNSCDICNRVDLVSRLVLCFYLTIKKKRKKLLPAIYEAAKKEVLHCGEIMRICKCFI
jgi:hypothetical protein